MFLNTLESKDRSEVGLADKQSILDEYVEQYLKSLDEIDDSTLAEWRSNLERIRRKAKDTAY